jgi:hypothetical protein
MEKPLQISELRRSFSALDSKTVAAALIGAVVEFLARMGHGPPRGC